MQTYFSRKLWNAMAAGDDDPVCAKALAFRCFNGVTLA
jgi:hypothetical protein